MSVKDLGVLVADKNMEYALKGLLSRPHSLNIRSIEADIIVHPQHDPACAIRGVEFLSNFSNRYHHALLMFDYEGSGKESISPKELQENINTDFSRSVWGERARTIILYPELEAWIWSPSPHVDDVIGWKGRNPSLRRWLRQQNWLQEGNMKPEHPKDAFLESLRQVGTPRSSSLYQKIAERVSLRNCVDISFLEFKDVLRNWFPSV